MASSSVVYEDTMSTPLSSAAPCACSTGNKASAQDLVDDFHQYISWEYLSPSSPNPVPLDMAQAMTNNAKIKTELTSSPDFRPSRLPTVPSTHNSTSHSPKVAISASYNPLYNTQRQDVQDVVNTSASLYKSLPVTRTSAQSQSTLGTTVSGSNPNSYQHDLIQSTSRPRTSTVFTSSQDLAAHYGIPQILPPAPRTTPRRTQPPRTASQSPVISDFASLSANYLNMLSSKPTDNSLASDTMTNVATVTPTELQAPEKASDSVLDDAQIGALAEYFSSPEFQSLHDFNEQVYNPNDFLTSPMPTPMDDFDSSPLDDSPFPEYLTTPVMADVHGANDMSFNNMPLFSDVSSFSPSATTKGTDETTPASKDQFKDLWSISPATPALESLDPTSLYPSPRLPSDRSNFPTTSASPATSASRRKTTATGTRKGVTPESLVPLDAPTQPRKYLTPSATSKKDLPAVIARKRARSQAFGDEEDELAEEPLSPTASEKEMIEWKRRQNTLAARKSRKRKLQHQQELEDKVDRLTQEKDVWRTRALTMQQILRSTGMTFPEFTD